MLQTDSNNEVKPESMYDEAGEYEITEWHKINQWIRWFKAYSYWPRFNVEKKKQNEHFPKSKNNVVFFRRVVQIPFLSIWPKYSSLKFPSTPSVVSLEWSTFHFSYYSQWIPYDFIMRWCRVPYETVLLDFLCSRMFGTAVLFNVSKFRHLFHNFTTYTNKMQRNTEMKWMYGKKERKKRTINTN